MVSARLVRLIEEHGEEIISRVINQIRRSPQMPELQSALGAELRHWGLDLLTHLGDWLGVSEEGLAQRYERTGKVLCDQDIPLSQGLRALFLMREKVMDFLEEQVLSKTHVDLYAEEETERTLDRFFDLLAIDFACGYERTLRKIVMTV